MDAALKIVVLQAVQMSPQPDCMRALMRADGNVITQSHRIAKIFVQSVLYPTPNVCKMLQIFVSVAVFFSALHFHKIMSQNNFLQHYSFMIVISMLQTQIVQILTFFRCQKVENFYGLFGTGQYLKLCFRHFFLVK